VIVIFFKNVKGESMQEDKKEEENKG